MARPTTLMVVLLAVMASIVTAQTDLFQFVNRIPQCGLTCILQEVPLSACGSLTNTTCICSDSSLQKATQNCVKANCESALDAIETAKVEAEACQRPFRDRRPQLFAPLSIEILGFFAVITRLYARWSMGSSFEHDDWIMLVCLVLYVPFVVLGQLIGQIAFGRDVWTVDPADLTKGLKLFYIDESFYLVILALTKISLLCFFLRIFPNQKFRWATYATMFVAAASTTVFVFLSIFQCVPIRFNWEGWKGQFGSHKCLDVNTIAFTAAGFSIGLDVAILLLPLPLLFKLNMNWRSKVGIIVMFSLGIFILITSCFRLQYLVHFARSVNPTWDYSDALMWSGLEVAVSMIVTSLPAIRMLLGRVMPGVFSTIASKTGLSGATGAGRRKGGSGDNSLQSAAADTKDVELQENVGKKDRGQHRRSGSKFGIYKMGAGRGDVSESQEELELGDRVRGEVQTEISVVESPTGSPGLHPYGGQLLRHSSSESGIHVQTTTTVDSTRGRV